MQYDYKACRSHLCFKDEESKSHMWPTSVKSSESEASDVYYTMFLVNMQMPD